MMHPNDHSSDAAFKLKEIDYFMQHFRVQHHDDLAMSIVLDLNGFLKLGGDHLQIVAYLEELEAYAEKTSSQDYVWELVYARRAIKRFFIGQENYEMASEHALISAKHFEMICKLYPSTHNLCCRIAEYLMAADNIKKTHKTVWKTNQIQQIYEHCHRLFGEIEDDKSILYYDVARDLYVNFYLFGIEHDDPQDVSHDRLLKYIDFSVKKYEQDGTQHTLKMILIAYAELSEFSKFSYEREKERICTVLAWAESAIEKGAAEIQRPYNRLKEIVRNFENPST